MMNTNTNNHKQELFTPHQQELLTGAPKASKDLDQGKAKIRDQVERIMSGNEGKGFEGWAETQNVSDLHADLMMAIRRIMQLTTESDRDLKTLLKLPLEILTQPDYLAFDKKLGDWPVAKKVDRKDIEFGSVFGRMLSHHPQFVNLMKYAHYNRVRAEKKKRGKALGGTYGSIEKRLALRELSRKPNGKKNKESFRPDEDLSVYASIDHNLLTGEDFLAVARYYYNKNVRTLVSTDFIKGSASDIDPKKKVLLDGKEQEQGQERAQRNKEKYWSQLGTCIEFNRMLGVRFVNDFDSKGAKHSPLPGPGESIGLFVLERGDLLISEVGDVDELKRIGIMMFAPQYGTTNLMVASENVKELEYGDGLGTIKASHGKEFPDGRLTDLGVSCVIRALELGMVIDLAHMWKTPRDQVLEIATRMGRKGQVVYSHGGIAEYSYRHGENASFTYKRSLTLEQMLKLKEMEGYVGLVPLLPHMGFENVQDKEAMEKLTDGFCDDVAKLVLEHGMGDRVFLAMDYLGTERASVPPQFGNYDATRRTLGKRLTERGLDENQIARFLWKNGQDFVLHTFLPHAPSVPPYPVSVKKMV